MSEAQKRLKNLIEMDLCSTENPEQYRQELRRMAEERANIKQARKQSQFFKALSDEKRIRILKLLSIREMCVCELMIALGTTQPNLSHHLKILENQGIIDRRKEGKWVYFSLANIKTIENIINSDFLKSTV